MNNFDRVAARLKRSTLTSAYFFDPPRARSLRKCATRPGLTVCYQCLRAIYRDFTRELDSAIPAEKLFQFVLVSLIRQREFARLLILLF